MIEEETHYGPDGGVRQSWLFTVSVQRLAESCGEKVTRHKKAAISWEERRDAAEERVRTEGLDLREAVKAGASNSGGYFQQPQLDAGLLATFREAGERVTYHRDHEKTYARWERLLQAVALDDPQATRDLTIADCVFFGL